MKTALIIAIAAAASFATAAFAQSPKIVMEEMMVPASDPGIEIFGKANTIVIHTNTGQTIQAAVSMRQSPPGANMSILMLNTNQGTLMVTVIAPNKIQVNLNGCMLQGDVTGSSANTQPMAAMPACNGITSATVQAK